MPASPCLLPVFGTAAVAELIAAPRATELLSRMSGRRVVVIGDVMIDEWIWGDVTRISPEAPVPVVAVRDHSFTLGGAGNVANNLRALGARVAFVGGIGNDPEGARLRAMFDDLGVDARGLLTLGDRPTTRKTRVVAHSQQVVRADWESTAPLRDDDRRRIVEQVRTSVRDADAVVLSDYAKGFLHRDIVEAALAAPVVVADPKPANVALFSGVTCIAPNVGEASRASGIPITDDDSLERAGRALLRTLGCRYVLITQGEHGMSLFGAQGERFDVPAVARTVFDVSGAGDTVVAVLTLALAAKIPAETATQLANFAAGAVVEKLGTATAAPREIIELMEHASGDAGASDGA
ncbi:MAG: D-glycero-beta-D-manno-heptose-7-phosphate kinase [Candidatus Eremiobacteraeota bacterium]|nr:D-glycero-beta-D-manno-heptose-7-phosphate kinase [Candidatus Eremiobacteraeota bacterium]